MGGERKVERRGERRVRLEMEAVGGKGDCSLGTLLVMYVKCKRAQLEISAPP